jgi:predicted metal-dependent hydrolase
MKTKTHKGIRYRVKESDRAKRMRLAVYCDASVVVTVPRGVEMGLIEKFLQEKRGWIEDKISYFTQFKNKPITRFSEADYKKHKDEALALACERVSYFNQIYGFSYNEINIKNQKTRWGSCSAKGNLNFNYKILFLPEAVRDYVVVHELCHLKEFNHSRKFWNLVAKTIPDFTEVKLELRKWEMSLD